MTSEDGPEGEHADGDGDAAAEVGMDSTIVASAVRRRRRSGRGGASGAPLQPTAFQKGPLLNKRGTLLPFLQGRGAGVFKR